MPLQVYTGKIEDDLTLLQVAGVATSAHALPFMSMQVYTGKIETTLHLTLLQYS